MADSKLSSLTAATVVTDADKFYMLEDTGVAEAEYKTTAAQLKTYMNVREKLSAARTYYFRTDASDTGRDGLTNSSGGAFLTIQRCINVINKDLDVAGQTVTVLAGDTGTFTGAVTLKNVVGFGGPGDLVIRGSDTGEPSRCLISTTSANCFTASALNVAWDVKDLKVQTTTGGTCLIAEYGGVIRFSNLDFGTSAGHHMYANVGGIIQATANSDITGGCSAGYHMNAAGGTVVLTFRTFTLIGTPAFLRFASASFGGRIQASVVTYSGGATGTRYVVTQNSAVDTNGGGANFFPGDAAGSTTPDGEYS